MLSLIRNFQRPINLASYVSFAPLAARQWIVATACILRVITGSTDKQIALMWRAGSIPNHLGPFHLVGLVVRVIKAVCVSAAVVIANLRPVAIVVSVARRMNQNRAGDKDVHGKTPNGGEAQHATIIPIHSARARLLFSRSAVFSLLPGESQQAATQNNPVSPHLAGQDSAITTELKNSLLGQSERFSRFSRGANHIECRLCHAGQFSEVAA